MNLYSIKPDHNFISSYGTDNLSKYCELFHEWISYHSVNLQYTIVFRSSNRQQILVLNIFRMQYKSNQIIWSTFQLVFYKKLWIFRSFCFIPNRFVAWENFPAFKLDHINLVYINFTKVNICYIRSVLIHDKIALMIFH